VTPIAEGVQLIHLSVSIKHDEVTDTRTFAIPLIVSAGGSSAAAPTPGVPAASAGATSTGASAPPKAPQAAQRSGTAPTGG